MSNRRFALLAGWIISAVTVTCGCGGSGQQTAAKEQAAVKEAISNVDGTTRNAEKFRALFADGSAPDDTTRKRFEPYMPSAREISVSGNTASAQVEFEVIATGQFEGPTQWTLEKVGGEWKIKTAPLP